MGKTSDLFNKIGDIKRTIQAKIGTIKDRSGMDLTRSRRYFLKRRQEYTEELYEKGLNDLDNHDGVVTHLKQGILESSRP